MTSAPMARPAPIGRPTPDAGLAPNRINSPRTRSIQPNPRTCLFPRTRTHKPISQPLPRFHTYNNVQRRPSILHRQDGEQHEGAPARRLFPSSPLRRRDDADLACATRSLTRKSRPPSRSATRPRACTKTSRPRCSLRSVPFRIADRDPGPVTDLLSLAFA